MTWPKFEQIKKTVDKFTPNLFPQIYTLQMLMYVFKLVFVLKNINLSNNSIEGSLFVVNNATWK